MIDAPASASHSVDQAPELPSVLQRWGDRAGSRTNVVLVLASRHVAFMDRQLAGDSHSMVVAPVQPFDYAGASAASPPMRLPTGCAPTASSAACRHS